MPRAASLANGRVPERTNGPVSKTVEAFCVSVGSNPTPSAPSGSGGAVSNLPPPLHPRSLSRQRRHEWHTRDQSEQVRTSVAGEILDEYDNSSGRQGADRDSERHPRSRVPP